MRSTDFPFAVMPQRLQRGGSPDYSAPSADVADLLDPTGIVGRGRLEARETSWRDKLKDELAVRFGRRNAEQLLTLADFTPAGAAFVGNEAALAAREGKRGEAAANVALAALPLPGAGKAAKKVAKGAKAEMKAAAPAVISTRSGTPEAVAADVLREAGKPSKGRPSYAEFRVKNPERGKLFDYSRLSEVPNVPQVQMPRYTPARGPSERIVSALANPEVERGINETVERGIAGGGLEWYNTDPMMERMRGLMPGGDVAPNYARAMDIVAATSPRARVPDNIRTASYYNYLLSKGLPIPEKPAPGYGSVAQKLHTQNVQGVANMGGWDVFKNPKPASFSTNLQGNQRNVTIDTHNFRLPGILAQDPRFLATSIVPEKGAEPFRPQKLLESGEMSLEQLLERPAFWEAKPNPNEYGYYEKWQQEQARKMGISPAQYQAAMWLGGGEQTGLGSAAEPFLETVEARVRYTADALGMDAERVLDMYLKGEIPLLAKGGEVDKEKLAEKYGV
jgi:hypothetical protein